jgi:hypothetical protein
MTPAEFQQQNNNHNTKHTAYQTWNAHGNKTKNYNSNTEKKK